MQGSSANTFPFHKKKLIECVKNYRILWKINLLPAPGPDNVQRKSENISAQLCKLSLNQSFMNMQTTKVFFIQSFCNIFGNYSLLFFILPNEVAFCVGSPCYGDASDDIDNGEKDVLLYSVFFCAWFYQQYCIMNIKKVQSNQAVAMIQGELQFLH